MTFDLKAAREICPRVKGYEDPDGGNFADFQAAEMLPAALDEIERLEAAYLKAQNSNLLRKQAYESLEKIASEQANRITEQSYGIKKLKENLSDYWQARDEQAKRIAELEADLEYYKSGFHSERGVHERVAAILGTDDAPWMLAQRAIERIAELEARRQLAAEHPDLFGPEDTTAKPAKIVLTEEQRAALELVCDLADEYECKYASTADEQSKAIGTVRALLQEART